jgi:hypothetical protein
MDADLFPEQARADVNIIHALDHNPGTEAGGRSNAWIAEIVIRAIADAGMEVRTVPRRWPVMMGASDCRSKAQDALASAATETNPKLRLEWETMAQQWADLAGRIDAE